MREIEKMLAEKGITEITFDQTGDFKAMRAAEDFLRERGYSVGTPQRGSPRGILKGNHFIAKWRNLSQSEILSLDGVMIGNMRSGPVTVILLKTEGEVTA